MPRKLYHVTAAATADVIDRVGFRDGRLSGFEEDFRGVSLSDRPLDVNDGPVAADVVFAVSVPDDIHLDYYEIVQEGWSYREWCLPAALVNTWPRRRSPKWRPRSMPNPNDLASAIREMRAAHTAWRKAAMKACRSIPRRGTAEFAAFLQEMHTHYEAFGEVRKAACERALDQEIDLEAEIGTPLEVDDA